jgi:hypothetical protein
MLFTSGNRKTKLPLQWSTDILEISVQQIKLGIGVTLKNTFATVLVTSEEMDEEVFHHQAATNLFQKPAIVCVVAFSPVIPVLPAEYSLMNSLATRISLGSE